MARADLEGARALYPSCSMGMGEWVTFFDSPPGLQALGRILYDIYDEVKSAEERKAGLRRIGRRPARAAVSLDDVMNVVLPTEFSNEPLHVALTQLIAGRSQRQFARKVPISQPHLSRILSGERVPGLEQLEQIAAAAGVQPWYFAEWRAKYIGDLITEALTRAPHLSIAALRSLRDGRRGIPSQRKAMQSSASSRGRDA
jgi:transcriptional regulator with XRE-family HTH domain